MLHVHAEGDCLLADVCCVLGEFALSWNRIINSWNPSYEHTNQLILVIEFQNHGYDISSDVTAHLSLRDCVDRC